MGGYTDDYHCPGCGGLIADLPVGHSWAISFETREWSCSGPAAPVTPEEFIVATSPYRAEIVPVGSTACWFLPAAEPPSSSLPDGPDRSDP